MDSERSKPRIAVVSDDASWRLRVGAALAEDAVPIGVVAGVGAVEAVRDAGVTLAIVAVRAGVASVLHALAGLPSGGPRRLLVSRRGAPEASRRLGRTIADGYVESDDPRVVAEAALAVLAGDRPERLRTGLLARWRTGG